MLYIYCFTLLLISKIQSLRLGIDHSNPISVEQFKCLLSQNYSFAIIRAWRSYGAFDVNCPQTLANALSAGYQLKDIGVYAFPCTGTRTPEDQINQMLRQLGNSQFTQIWIDMETNPSPNCGWSSNTTYNCQFTQKLAQEAKKSGKIVGIYASNHMWNEIMGGSNNCPRFTDLPLWYAHYDNKQSFEDYQQFGGWPRPSIKQFKGTSSVCGVNGLDLNLR